MDRLLFIPRSSYKWS